MWAANKLVVGTIERARKGNNLVKLFLKKLRLLYLDFISILL